MNKVNYDLAMTETIKKLDGRPSLLLHSCCAPCSSACLERLTPFFDVTVFYFNPNITESEEYYLRLREQKKFLQEAYGDKVGIIEGRYKSAEFFDIAKGLEKAKEGGERCYKCYSQRLKETASAAREQGFDYFCTTLSVSPYKNAEWINELGEKFAKEYGVKFLPSDFKKRNGYRRSVELSEEYGLYRQNYCGCIYSKYRHIGDEDESDSGQA